ncbi:hypothetical protein [Nitrobacter sp. JJSN]|uniref:hypothetical protein n=1 Tax=Nitrobacter sp. JJSN TaxID=3453033 RepID=UPI003F767C4D
MQGLFSTKKPKKLLHPSFQILQSSPRNKSTRRLMNDAFARLTEKDGNFVEQFQTTGFNTRTFELYVSELLHAEGFKFEGKEPQPDFCVSKNGTSIAIECTTANPTGDGKGGMHVYEGTNEKDRDIEGLRERQENEVPIKIAGALRSKMLHRLDRKKDPKAYWELPHVAGKPFILAIQTFHEHGALGFSNAAVVRYLYGIEHSPTWDDAGNLVINAERVFEHAYEGRVIPAGFFSLPDSENVSAVLWTNAGTVAKFTRMALAGPYPDGELTDLRYGTAFDFDPNAHAPLPFAYIVGDEGAPEETWGQEANLFHNPHAKYPVPRDLFDTVTDSQCTDGQYSDVIKSDFSPIMSMSMLISGPGHRRLAVERGEQVLAALEEVYAPLEEKRGSSQPQK